MVCYCMVYYVMVCYGMLCYSLHGLIHAWTVAWTIVHAIYCTSGHADLKQTGKIYVPLACDAPPDTSKHLHLVHVIYENDGISAGNVWVSTINQYCQKF